MPNNRKKDTEQERWAQMDAYLRLNLPDLMGWLGRNDEFSGLNLKARDDGTTLAIAKGYGSDGGPVVCFGSGYGAVLALMAINGSIRGGNWRVDKPWQPKGN